MAGFGCPVMTVCCVTVNKKISSHTNDCTHRQRPIPMRGAHSLCSWYREQYRDSHRQGNGTPFFSLDFSLMTKSLMNCPSLFPVSVSKATLADSRLHLPIAFMRLDQVYNIPVFKHIEHKNPKLCRLRGIAVQQFGISWYGASQGLIDDLNHLVDDGVLQHRCPQHVSEHVHADQPRVGRFWPDEVFMLE